MEYDESEALHVRARLAGFLFLFVNALYIASLVSGAAGPEEVRRPAVALQACASAATIAMAWAFYELLKPWGQGLALMALLFRAAESALYGVVAVFSLLLVGDRTGVQIAQDSDVWTLMSGAQLASGQIGTLYFCAGSAIFFYLLLKSRLVPRTVAALGLVATVLTFASILMQIVAPTFAKYVAFDGPLLLLAEAVTGVWLLVGGAGRRHRRLSDPSPAAP